MSADAMPCGCLGHADNLDLCEYPRLARYAQHTSTCSRGLPSAGHPCNCGLFNLLRDEDGFRLSQSKKEQDKRTAHPEYGPWDREAPDER